MKTSSKQQVPPPLGRMGERVSLHRVFDQFQSALICIDQFGFCAGLTMGFFMLISFVLHAARAGAEKGVI